MFPVIVRSNKCRVATRFERILNTSAQNLFSINGHCSAARGTADYIEPSSVMAHFEVHCNANLAFILIRIRPNLIKISQIPRWLFEDEQGKSNPTCHPNQEKL